MPAALTLQADAKLGALRLGGAPMVALPVAFVPALHEALVHQFGDHAQDVLYRSGYEWGLQAMASLNSLLRTEFGPQADFWQMDAKFILDRWWSTFAETGWGQCTFDLASFTRGLAGVELRGSTVAAALHRSDQPVCHLYAGLFAGAVSFYDRHERHAAEVQCTAAGGPVCRFVVADGPQIDQAETWRQQGIAPEEIRRRLG